MSMKGFCFLYLIVSSITIFSPSLAQKNAIETTGTKLVECGSFKELKRKILAIDSFPKIDTVKLDFGYTFHEFIISQKIDDSISVRYNLSCLSKGDLVEDIYIDNVNIYVFPFYGYLIYHGFSKECKLYYDEKYATAYNKVKGTDYTNYEIMKDLATEKLPFGEDCGFSDGTNTESYNQRIAKTIIKKHSTEETKIRAIEALKRKLKSPSIRTRIYAYLTFIYLKSKGVVLDDVTETFISKISKDNPDCLRCIGCEDPIVVKLSELSLRVDSLFE
jgi:hypothetical protein